MKHADRVYHHQNRTPKWLIVLRGALAVALVSAVMAIPVALGALAITPDGIEFLAIANAWIQGAGFVDPIQWYYHLPQGPPLPAFAVRPPALPVLIAIALAFGATIPMVFVLHAAWASIIAGLVFITARRFMRPLAAAGAALLLVASPAWILLSAAPMTEITAMAAYLLVLATARGTLRSVPAAFLCAGATILAWMTRPNLGAVAPAVTLAAIWEMGRHRGIRRASIWAYATGFALFYLAIRVSVSAATGYAPYAGYGIVAESLKPHSYWDYENEYVSLLALAVKHPAEVLTMMAEQARRLHGALFLSPTFNYVGWLLPPALLYALWGRREGSLEYRINALCAAGFGLIVVVVVCTAWDLFRYPFLIAATGGLCVLAMLDDLAQALDRRLHLRSGGRITSVLAALPLVTVVCIVGLGSARIFSVPYVVASWQRYQELARKAPRRQDVEGGIRNLCPYMTTGGVFVSSTPWSDHMFCGNAAVLLPRDLGAPGVLDRFLDERQPTYFVIASSGLSYNALKRSPRLREVVRVRGIVPDEELVLFEVLDQPPHSQSWSLPRPLVCAGRGKDCASGLHGDIYPESPVEPYDSIMLKLMGRLAPPPTSPTLRPRKTTLP